METQGEHSREWGVFTLSIYVIHSSCPWRNYQDGICLKRSDGLPAYCEPEPIWFDCPVCIVSEGHALGGLLLNVKRRQHCCVWPQNQAFHLVSNTPHFRWLNTKWRRRRWKWNIHTDVGGGNKENRVTNIEIGHLPFEILFKILLGEFDKLEMTQHRALGTPNHPWEWALKSSTLSQEEKFAFLISAGQVRAVKEAPNTCPFRSLLEG